MTSLTRIPTDQLPDCLRRDRLSGPYFPAMSRGTLAVVVILCSLFALSSFQRLPADLWADIALGRWIVEHRALPAVEPFAASSSPLPLGSDAWLSQVLGYGIEHWLGPEGLVLGRAPLLTLTAGVLIFAVALRGTPLALAALAGAAFFLLDLPFGTIGPQLFGQLGAALVLLACSELPARRHPLLWLPLVGMLWANLDASSLVIGVAILSCHAFGTTWSVFRGERRNFAASVGDWRVLVAAAALLLAGACLNPQGPLLLAGIKLPTGGNSLTPASTTGVLLVGSLIVTACLWKLGGRRFELGELLLLAIFALATLSDIRLLAWWAIVWPWVMAPRVAAAWTNFNSRRGARPADEPTPMRTLIALGCIFTAAIIAPPSYGLITGKSRGETELTAHDTPVHLADQVCRLRLAGSCAAPIDWADYLVFRSEGKLKPLIHGRMLPAQQVIFADYGRIFRGDEPWRMLLSSHRIQYLLLSKERHRALAAKVAGEIRAGRLRIVYQDQRGLIVELTPPAR